MELTESPQMRNGDMGQKVTSKGLVGEADLMTGCCTIFNKGLGIRKLIGLGIIASKEQLITHHVSVIYACGQKIIFLLVKFLLCDFVDDPL